MNIDEFIYMTESASDEFDMCIIKNQYYAESSEMLKKVKLSELKFQKIKEGSDSNDFYTESVITEKHVDNVEKMIEKSLTDFSKYIAKVTTAFNDQFKSIDIIKDLDISKELRTNRMLGKTKVSTINANAEMKIINKYIDMNMKFIHKLSSGMANKSDVDKLENLMDKYEREIATIRKNNSMIDEPYTKVYKDYVSNVKKFPSFLKMVETENSDFSHDVLIPIIRAKKTGKDTEIMSIGTKALSNDSFLHKDLVDCYVKQLTSEYSVIKNIGKNSIKTESYVDDMSLLDELTSFYNETYGVSNEIDQDDYDVVTESSSRAPAIKKTPRDIKKYITNDGIDNVAKTPEAKGLAIELIKLITASNSPIVVTKSGVSKVTKDAINKRTEEYKASHDISKIKEERSVLNYIMDIISMFNKDAYGEAVKVYTDTVNDCVAKSDSSALDVMIKDLQKGSDGIMKTKVTMDDSVAKVLLDIVKKGRKQIPTVKKESANEEFDIDKYFDTFNNLLD